MIKQKPKIIYRKDYQKPLYNILSTDLIFDLYDDHTIVQSTLNINLNNAEVYPNNSIPNLVLQGEDVELISIKLDNQLLNTSHYLIDNKELTLLNPKHEFTLEIKTRIHPEKNTSLEGLYKSNSMFCTQCEAEGFRKITYYLDRPDIMSTYSTKIIADQKKYPVLLSNGNQCDQGNLDSNRHFVYWQDQFKKPSYLFALVAGNLEYIEDYFITASNRKVVLRIFTESHNIDKCDYAMSSLKKAMAWDEKVYGREYDLDIFMIVAVDHFNMGAMENKGLNIFNSSCILASPSTASDSDYQRIEAIIAHEYFHNWSGNRVTCRDWFQLSLKEGFTVFRDSEFSADMNSRGVKRIEDASLVKTHQFAEDSGPMAHPIRPDSFIEISNFYTLTVYEKGAEVVRMIHTILGAKRFRKATDLYFDRHDGQAVTCEDFIKAMENSSGEDFTQFRNWYRQAGTPIINIKDQYDSEKQQYHLTIRQTCRPTPNQTHKDPFHIPILFSLLDKEGKSLPLDKQGNLEKILHLKDQETTFLFNKIKSPPTPSLLRNFSSPVKIEYPYTEQTLLFLIKHESDAYNKWDAWQKLTISAVNTIANDEQKPISNFVIHAFKNTLMDESINLSLKSDLLTLPSLPIIEENFNAPIQPINIYLAKKRLKSYLANMFKNELLALYQKMNIKRSYQPISNDITERKLKNTCLNYLMEINDISIFEIIVNQYETATNMTDIKAAFIGIINADYRNTQKVTSAINNFYQRFKDESTVLDHWLGIQASSPNMGNLSFIKNLMKHDCFDITSPNKVRAVLSNFSANHIHFHAHDGSGYRFIADQVISLNNRNPQIAARLLSTLIQWKKYEEKNGLLMKQALEQVFNSPNLSTDVYEIANKGLSL